MQHTNIRYIWYKQKDGCQFINTILPSTYVHGINCASTLHHTACETVDRGRTMRSYSRALQARRFNACLLCVVMSALCWDETCSRGSATNDALLCIYLLRRPTELTIMGVISLGVFLTLELGDAGGTLAFYGFEFSHIVLFFTALIFVMQVRVAQVAIAPLHSLFVWEEERDLHNDTRKYRYSPGTLAISLWYRSACTLWHLACHFHMLTRIRSSRSLRTSVRCRAGDGS